jgi:hypothetical protein
VSTTDERVLRALRSGPLYEGALALVLDEPDDLLLALRRLQKAGRVERMPEQPYTWRLVEQDAPS